MVIQQSSLATLKPIPPIAFQSRGRACALALLAATVTHLQAQTPLTWEQVKAKFIAANPTLMAGQINIDESKAEEITAYLRPNPNFSDIFLETNTGFSGYNGLQLSVIRRVSQGLHIEGAYTYGHVIDNVQDQGLFASEPQDNNNIKEIEPCRCTSVKHSWAKAMKWRTLT